MTLGDEMSLLVRRTTLALGMLLGLAIAAVSPAAAVESGRPFTISLSGAAEVTAGGVPNQGDPDGIGTAVLHVNPGQAQLCWAIEVTMVDPITAAHVHAAPSTTTGPVVVPLNPYSGGCTQVSRALALALITHPELYYVNVHNASYPGGAMRGQLSR
jgi:hypothetical protein